MAPEDEKKRRMRKSKNNKRINIELKMDVLSKFKKGMKVMEIARSVNLSEATVRSIRKNKIKIEECATCLTSEVSRAISRPRHPIIHTTETLVYDWIVDQRSKGEPLTFKLIQCKAQMLFDELKAQRGDTTCPQFIASKGWIDRFKKRFNLKRILSGEPASADEGGFLPIARHMNDLLVNKNNELNEVNAEQGNLVNQQRDFSSMLEDWCSQQQELTLHENEQVVLDDNVSVETNETEQYTQDLSKAVNLAEELKLIISKVENDKERNIAFAATLDGLMSYYKNILVFHRDDTNLNHLHLDFESPMKEENRTSFAVPGIKEEPSCSDSENGSDKELNALLCVKTELQSNEEVGFVRVGILEDSI